MRGLLLEELVQRGGYRRLPRCAGEFDEQPLTLALAEHRQLGGRYIRPRHDVPQQRLEVRRHLVNGGGVEEIGVVLELRQEMPVPFLNVNAQVEHGKPGFLPNCPHLHAGHAQPVVRVGCELEHYLEQRIARQAAAGVDGTNHSLEGDVLVRVGLEAHTPETLEEARKRGSAVHARAQHDRVDEQSDQTVDLGVSPVRNGSAEHDLVLIGVAPEGGSRTPRLWP